MDAESLLHALVGSGIDYVLIGGLAMTVRACAHVTEDVDIACRLTGLDAARLREALAPLRPQERQHESAAVSFVTDAGPLDVFRLPCGVTSLEELRERSEAMSIYGYTVRVASVGALLAMKRATDRLHDQVHRMELEALSRLLGVAETRPTRSREGKRHSGISPR